LSPLLEKGIINTIENLKLFINDFSTEENEEQEE
jgi:hypothetical protein